MPNPFNIDLTVKYHLQDKYCLCGPAVAQMILGYIDDKQNDIPQDMLWHTIHNHFSSSWFTSPNGLAYGLNTLRPQSFSGSFSVEPADTVDAGSEKIVQALYHPSATPVAALIIDCGHWVVVRGFNTDVEPAVGTEYSILGFWVNEPWLVNDAPPPPPHNNDDSCGTTVDRGQKHADEYVPYDAWGHDPLFFHGCADHFGTLRFITVCSNRRAKTGTLRPSTPARTPFFTYGTEDRDDGGFIASRHVHEIVRHAIAQHGLGGRDGERTPFADMQPGTPRLVQRLDAVDKYYFLVPLQSESHFAFARVDAVHGKFLGVSGACSDKGQRSRTYGLRLSDDVTRDVSGRLVSLCSENAYVLRDGSYTVHPTLVWRPCQETPSPYDPFHQINTAGGVLYLDARNQIYSSLTDLHRGS